MGNYKLLGRTNQFVCLFVYDLLLALDLLPLYPKYKLNKQRRGVEWKDLYLNRKLLSCTSYITVQWIQYKLECPVTIMYFNIPVLYDFSDISIWLSPGLLAEMQ